MYLNNLEIPFILGYNAHCVHAPKRLLMTIDDQRLLMTMIIIKIISILEYN